MLSRALVLSKPFLLHSAVLCRGVAVCMLQALGVDDAPHWLRPQLDTWELEARKRTEPHSCLRKLAHHWLNSWKAKYKVRTRKTSSHYRRFTGRKHLAVVSDRVCVRVCIFRYVRARSSLWWSHPLMFCNISAGCKKRRRLNKRQNQEAGRILSLCWTHTHTGTHTHI